MTEQEKQDELKKQTFMFNAEFKRAFMNQAGGFKIYWDPLPEILETLEGKGMKYEKLEDGPGYQIHW